MVRRGSREKKKRHRRRAVSGSSSSTTGSKKDPKEKIIDEYEYHAGHIPIKIKIYHKKGEYIPIYDVTITAISRTTEIILERIRKELVKEVTLEMGEITDPRKLTDVEDHFRTAIGILIKKYFPAADPQTISYLTTYLIQKALGMGQIENLMEDERLEEITINGAHEPVWVYHRQHGWLKTTIQLESDDQIRHFSSMVARKVGRQISVSEPLLDAHLPSGDRLNATLSPITIQGNTMTIRKFTSKPWTMTDMIRTRTISAYGAAFIWQGIQYEMSMLVAGGTASGKTSMLNAIANFFPPNQRIISIEDTHEIRLPKYLHWVPMVTRLANPEGKGAVSMLDLLINSLRMRPDRIIVGEIRRKEEAQVLFEAIHTGHSVYATVHANNTHETVTRLVSPPIEIPKTMLPAISLIIVQSRNRRTGTRRTYQISEVSEDGNGHIIMQYNLHSDELQEVNVSLAVMANLVEFTGLTERELIAEIEEKAKILTWMVDLGISEVDEVGIIMAEFYTDKKNLLPYVDTNKRPPFLAPKKSGEEQ